jgi:hypothetical protein
MDTGFQVDRTRCYQQAARLMARGASLSLALRGCLRTPRAAVPTEPKLNQRSVSGE